MGTFIDVLKPRYIAWLKRRNPVAPEITLDQKRIFIFPTKVGLLYGMLMVLIFINAINYKNNLMIMLCFLLASVFVTVILHTYSNLSGLKIKAGHSLPVFVGDTVQLPLTLSGSRRNRFGVLLGFQDQAKTQLAVIDKDTTRTHVGYSPTRRGWIETPRLKLRSIFPLGIIRSWSWLYLDFHGLAYPKPLHQPFKYYVGDESGKDEGEIVDQSGIDDFRGFKDYTPGDPLKHIAWKQYAKRGELLTKEFEETHVSAHWLDWRALAGIDTEMRLQILCGWVLKSHEENFEYGLRLPNQTIALGRGDHHRDECLKALALFNQPKSKSDGGAA